MVTIPGGTFRMGSESGGGDAERPVTVVTLSPYFLDRTEVTVSAYGACVSAGACTRPDTDVWCNWGRSGRENHPVNCVDWTQAETYCRWAGKRLPTEAEWEFAARGTDGRTYPWGNEAPSNTRLRWNSDGNSDGTAPVGSYPAGASPYGVMDLSGNVWEWVSDGYGAYPGGSIMNPRGPSGGQSRVSRGGGWDGVDPSRVRAAGRGGSSSALRVGSLGFRCARGGS